ncbi:hypothetical protein SH528x_004893 [Novipirellula sp. SH528]|uniref:baeRF3 domain-containing protein n=1 Tax=Novipirellula sp. SH528 TaxID=3454466 RepID=UPI003FA14159
MAMTTSETILQTLKPGDLEELASITAKPCVSILMRTHRSGPDTQQGSIRLKNLLNDASKKLKSMDHDDAILDQVKEGVRESNFWQHQGEGLAIFLTPDKCQMFRLNREVDETVHVGETFLLFPLIREQGNRDRYFVLSITWDEAKLFQRRGESLELIETDSLPAKFNDLILPRDPEVSLQNRSHQTLGNTGGSSTAMFHGHGQGEDKVEADREHYLSLVGEEVVGAMYNTGLPLVVVATEEVNGHLQAVSDVSVDAKVNASPSQWKDADLRDHAHKAIAPKLDSQHDQFEERFGTALAQSKGSNDIADVLDAAKNGRIESVMIRDGARELNRVNEIVIETLRNGGDVFSKRFEDSSDAAEVAAIYRF